MTKHDNNAYVKHILDVIGIIEKYLEGKAVDDFETDKMLQDATIREIEIIGEASAKIPDEFKTKNSGVDWQKASDMRNRLIHGYDDIDLEIVWQTCQEDLPDLKSTFDFFTHIDNNKIMKTNTLKETKSIIDKLPEEKIRLVRLFVEWLNEEKLTESELKAVLAGEQEIKSGRSVSWRSIARTI